MYKVVLNRLSECSTHERGTQGHKKHPLFGLGNQGVFVAGFRKGVLQRPVIGDNLSFTSTYRWKAGEMARRFRSRGRSLSKGKIRGGKSVQYAIIGPGGRGQKTKYIGTTNNPRRRAIEHLQNGKMSKGDRLVVQTKPISRKSALRVESSKLAAHRRQHGRNPRHNRTNDGGYHPRRSG